MIRSMYTAISSLHLHQYFMDVVADNLSNVNTNGYKANRFSFQDQFAQLMSAGSAPTETLGGVNPVQIGLGTRMGTANSTFTQGPLQATGRNTDLAIQGEGMFIYSNGEGGVLYSRDGMLDIDAEGYLVNPASGLRVQGWVVDDAGNIDAAAAVGDIQLPLDATLARATTEGTIGGNLDARLDPASTNNEYNTTVGVYDSLGTLQTATITFRKTAASTWDVIYDGNTVSTLTFDADGKLPADTTLDLTITPNPDNGADPVDVTFDISGITQLSTEGSVSMLTQNGLAAGSLTTFTVEPETGNVYGMFSNGLNSLMGQVALAKFANPAGLVRVGQNLFQQGLNSGEPSIGAPATGGRGPIVSGYLEGSNVDMAQEFTNMILAQRGFQASSRVITTSDQMLQELVNIQR